MKVSGLSHFEELFFFFSDGQTFSHVIPRGFSDFDGYGFAKDNGKSRLLMSFLILKIAISSSFKAHRKKLCRNDVPPKNLCGFYVTIKGVKGFEARLSVEILRG